MAGRIQRAPRPIVIIGAYLLLAPQLAFLAFSLVLVVFDFVSPGSARGTFGAWVTPGTRLYLLALMPLLVGLIWIYLSILRKLTGRANRYRKQLALLRRRRCPECGYDLRASTDRCPECGRSMYGGGSGAA